MPWIRESMLALISALLVPVGCAGPSSAAPQYFTVGSTGHSSSFGGLDRSFRSCVPAGCTAVLVVPIRPNGPTAGISWRTARSSWWLKPTGWPRVECARWPLWKAGAARHRRRRTSVARQPAGPRGSDPPSGALDAMTTLWAFFAAHPRVR
jgi:hypothetical protein